MEPEDNGELQGEEILADRLINSIEKVTEVLGFIGDTIEELNQNISTLIEIKSDK